MKFEYLQQSCRNGNKERRLEIWNALGHDERQDLAEAHQLADGEHDEFFLIIVEQDRMQRSKVTEEPSEYEMVAEASETTSERTAFSVTRPFTAAPQQRDMEATASRMVLAQTEAPLSTPLTAAPQQQCPLISESHQFLANVANSRDRVV